MTCRETTSAVSLRCVNETEQNKTKNNVECLHRLRDNFMVIFTFLRHNKTEKCGSRYLFLTKNSFSLKNTFHFMCLYFKVNSSSFATGRFPEHLIAMVIVHQLR